MNLIRYNWMTEIADWKLDREDAHYIEAGVSPPKGGSKLEFNRVSEGDIVFTKPEFIASKKFQTEFLPYIKSRFILISGIGSTTPENYKDIIKSDLIVHWFTTNPPIVHEKITGLPIGFEEQDRTGGNPRTLNELRQGRLSFNKKLNRILLPRHEISTNIERKKLIEELIQNPLIDYVNSKLDFKSYVQLLNEYKYVICLPGSGLDTHRFYESLLVDSIPIILSNPLDELYKKWKIPFVSLKRWNDLKKFDKFLMQEFEPNSIKRFLYLENHIKMIQSIRYINFLRT